MNDYTELKRLAEAAVGKTYSSGEKFFFSAEATPEQVLALIAENESLRADLREAKDAKLGLSWAIGEIMGECDQLKVENETLRKGAERYQWMSTEGNWVARFYGKWRAHVGEYGYKQPTDWYPSRDEAIDAAMRNGRPDSCGSEQGQNPTETPVPERSACRSENP